MSLCDSCKHYLRGFSNKAACAKNYFGWTAEPSRLVHRTECKDYEEPVRFTKTIPTEFGFYWVDPGEGVSDSPHTNDYEIVKVDPSTRYGDRMFTFSHKVDFLDLSEIQNEFLKEDKGLFGPKIEPPTELVSTATEWRPK